MKICKDIIPLKNAFFNTESLNSSKNRHLFLLFVKVHKTKMINTDGGFIEIMHGHISQRAKNEFKKRVAAFFLMCNVLIPLVIGTYIYIYMDGDSYFGNFVRSFISISIFETTSNIAKAMRNWGCDFLFAYALLFALYGCTRVLAVSIRYAAVCSIGLELLQLIQIDFLKCGTFDVVDIVVEMIAICFGATFISCFNHIKRKERRK